MQGLTTEIDRGVLAAVEELVAVVGQPAFRSQFEYEEYCHVLYTVWRGTHTALDSGQRFREQARLIQTDAQGTARTAWGGYHVTNLNHPDVEKYVTVLAGCFFPFEYHEEKVESLVCLEGAGVILHQLHSTPILTAEPMVTNYSITIAPRDRHAVVALEDLLIFERSTEPKGLNRDDVPVWGE